MMSGQKKTTEAHGVEIAEKDQEISELKEELRFLNTSVREDQRDELLEEHRLEMMRKDEESDDDSDEESDDDSDEDGITMSKHN